MYENDKIVMLMPALASCPGLPVCAPPKSLCDDHKDVYRAMERVEKAERERCAKITLAKGALAGTKVEDCIAREIADAIRSEIR